MELTIEVDVIIAVHNAESTIEETVKSAMHQTIPEHLLERKFNCKHSSEIGETEFCMKDIRFDVLVCCYNDASTDKSLEILHLLGNSDSVSRHVLARSREVTIPTKLIIGSAPQGTTSRGAGYARNQAVKLRSIYQEDKTRCKQEMPSHHFLCILDSDDLMHSTRVAEQTCAMLNLGFDTDGLHLYRKTLMGCQFDRLPKDSTWHYQNWANSLSDDRLYLEQFRECTLIQPTWFIAKELFDELGGYLEAPENFNKHCGTKRKLDSVSGIENTHHYQLIHPSELTASGQDSQVSNSLRLAEDLRFFYAHLLASGNLYLHRTSQPLVSYRHRSGMSQSSSTPRKLLLKLRAKAWEDLVYYGRARNNNHENNTVWAKRGFVVWGAGRDGKDFVKSLSSEVASKIVCFVDVDEKKINHIKYYDNPDLGKRIPIFHFSVLRKANNFIEGSAFGRIDKRKENVLLHSQNLASKPEDGSMSIPQQNSILPISEELIAALPVVVCVAMYRSNGALESNVASIGRIEGEDLWHMS
jgi:glycosyltransferase involved in cell wall biosynthesis